VHKQEQKQESDFIPLITSRVRACVFSLFFQQLQMMRII